MTNRSWSQTGRGGATGIVYGHFLGQVRMYREKMVAACDELQRVHPAFNAGRDACRSHCDFAISSLACFKEPVLALYTLFREALALPISSEHYYPVMLSLSQSSEQGQQLQSRISAYRHICQTYTPQLVYQKLAIYDSIEQLIECSKETHTRIEHFMNETRFSEQKRTHQREEVLPGGTRCEDKLFATSNAEPRYDTITLLQQPWPRSSHRGSRPSQQTRKIPICSRSPVQQDT